MKKFLFLLLIPSLALARTAEKPAMKLPVKESPAPEISREDLRRTVVHIQSLARDQQNELDATRMVNDKLQEQLAEAQSSHKLAQGHANDLQVQVNRVTEDRNAQAAMKDKALNAADHWKQKHAEAVKKLWWWRLRFGLVAVLGGVLIIGFLLLRFTKWGASTLGPIVTKTLV